MARQAWVDPSDPEAQADPDLNLVRVVVAREDPGDPGDRMDPADPVSDHRRSSASRVDRDARHETMTHSPRLRHPNPDPPPSRRLVNWTCDTNRSSATSVNEHRHPTR
jgi:hypothetical protein